MFMCGPVQNAYMLTSLQYFYEWFFPCSYEKKFTLLIFGPGYNVCMLKSLNYLYLDCFKLFIYGTLYPFFGAVYTL